MIRRTPLVLSFSALLFALGACSGGQGNGNVPGDPDDHQAFSAIAADEVVHFTGTEPFWGGQVSGNQLTFSTPENIDGDVITVARFAGRGGLSFNGQLQGQDLDLMVTPGECSDGMSDRLYPFVATANHGGAMLYGCAWTDQQGFTGPEAP